MGSSNEQLAEQIKLIAEELGKRYPDLDRVTVVFTWKQANQDSFLTGVSSSTDAAAGVDPVSIIKTMQQLYRFSEHMNSALLQGVSAVELQFKTLIENLEALRRQHEQGPESTAADSESPPEDIQRVVADMLDRGSRLASQAKEPQEPFAP